MSKTIVYIVNKAFLKLILINTELFTAFVSLLLIGTTLYAIYKFVKFLLERKKHTTINSEVFI